MVNPLILGTMTFGQGDWRAGEREAAALFRSYRDAGGWTFDTADVYGGGAAEELLGTLVAQDRCRDDVVIATKASAPARSGGANARGNGRKHLLAALEGSLRRLRTDYVDLFWLHLWDGRTPVEDVLLTLDDIVRSGKARAVGLSNVPAWYAATAVALARAAHQHAPAGLQLEYSLVERACEREHAPLAAETGLSLVPWGPLAGGLLTGKYRRPGGCSAGRLADPASYPDRRHLTDAERALIDRLCALSDGAGVEPAQLALAWLLQRPAVDAVIVGATSVHQLRSNLGCLDVRLTADQRESLQAALPESRPGSPYRLFAAAL